jgi:hypothetical protein
VRLDLGSVWTASSAGFSFGLVWAFSQQGAEVKRERGRKVEVLWCGGVVWFRRYGAAAAWKRAGCGGTLTRVIFDSRSVLRCCFVLAVTRSRGSMSSPLAILG